MKPHLIRATSTVKTVNENGTTQDLTFGKGASVNGLVRDLVRYAGAEIPVQLGWINALEELPVLDDIGEFGSLNVIAEWDNGDVEQSRLHLIALDTPCFQRMDGTDENCEGWNGNVGKVVRWMPMPDKLN